jgi:hypothetical protein
LTLGSHGGAAHAQDVTTGRFDDDVDVAKLARMHGLVLNLLAELRHVELDPASAERLESLTQQTLVEIGSAVPDDLLAELGRVMGGASTDGPTPDELRVVEAQLLGWLRGMVRASRFEDLQAIVHATRDAVAHADPAGVGMPASSAAASGAGYL